MKITSNPVFEDSKTRGWTDVISYARIDFENIDATDWQKAVIDYRKAEIDEWQKAGIQFRKAETDVHRSLVIDVCQEAGIEHCQKAEIDFCQKAVIRRYVMTNRYLTIDCQTIDHVLTDQPI
jgi:hypothetical protein